MIKIRDAHIFDMEAITAIYNEVVLENSASFDINPKTTHDFIQWFNHYKDRFPIRVATSDTQILGYIALTPYGQDEGYQYTVKLQIYVHQDARGQGVGRQLIEDILVQAKSVYKFHTIISEITSTNQASLQLHQALNFQYCGHIKECGYKFNQFHDMDIYQIIL